MNQFTESHMKDYSHWTPMKFNIDSKNSNINTFCSVFPTNLSPFHHVTIAGGRDPNVLHSNQYGLSAENGSCLLMMATFSGRTKITHFY